MSPIKWRMLHVLLNDAIDATPPGTDDRNLLYMAREVAKNRLDLKKMPHKPYLHHKMQS